MRRRFYPLISLLMVFGLAGISSAQSEGGHYPAAAGEIPDAVAGVNHLWREVMIDITIIGILFALVTLYSAIFDSRCTVLFAKDPGTKDPSVSGNVVVNDGR